MLAGASRSSARRPPVSPQVRKAVAYILVVEDYKPLRVALQRLLERAGYKVIAAEHGVDALQKMQEHGAPALIISDIMMPVMDGYEFYEAVRTTQAWTSIPFLFLTAKGGEEDVLLGKKLGAEDYIVKPISEETLLAAVAGRLHRAEALKQAQQRTMEAFLQELVQSLLTRLRHPVGHLDQDVMKTFDLLVSEDTEAVTAYLSRLRTMADELVLLSERLLWLARYQSGEMVHELELTRTPYREWAALAQGAWEACAPKVRERIAQVRFDFPAELPEVICSPLWTERALILLLEQGAELLPGHVAEVVLSGTPGTDTYALRLTLFLPGVYLTSNGWEVLMHRPTSMERATVPHFHLYLAREIMRLQGGELDFVTAPDGVRLSLLFPR